MALDYTGAGALYLDEPASLILQSPIPVIATTVLRLTLTVRKVTGADAVLTAGVLCYDN